MWRLLDLYDRHQLPITVFTVGMAAERNPDVIAHMVAGGHEICSHGYRWIDYQYVDIDTEREHMSLAIEALTRAAGTRPLGWYTGRTGPNSRRLVVEEGGFLYDADDYSDELPFWTQVDGTARAEDAVDRSPMPPHRPARAIRCAAAQRGVHRRSERVWVSRKVDVARHWRQHHPFAG